METVANAFNLYINTDRNLSSGSKGDRLALPLGQTPIVAGDDEHIRMTLDQFSMKKSWSDVNSNNNQFKITNPNGGTGTCTILPGDYAPSGLRTLQAYVATAMLETLNTLYATGQFALIEPTGADNLTMTTTQILTMGFKSNVAMTTAQLPIVQCFTSMGDSYKVLGAKRIVGTPEGEVNRATRATYNTGSTFQSMLVYLDEADTTKLFIRGYYRADMTPETHVYMAIDNQMSHNIGTNSFTAGNTADPIEDRSGMNSSRILAAIPIDTKYARYVANTDRQYFVDLASRVASELRIVLVDSVGRSFPYLNEDEGTLGDRSFKAVIRVDILKGNKTGTLKSKPTPKSVPPRFSSAPSSVLNLGIPGYGLNVPGQVYGDGFVPLSK